METRTVAIALGLLGLAGLAYAATRAARNGLFDRADLGGAGWGGVDGGAVDQVGPPFDLVTLSADVFDATEVLVNRATEVPSFAPPDVAQANVSAFLAAIRASEGTDRAGDPYRVVFGYGHTIQDLSDHPYYTGEWKGAPFGAGQWSTAAGAYQFLRATWADLRGRLQLPDFGPASQDAAAVELIRQRGALEDVKAGRFGEAVLKVRRVWASLPGAGYGQPEHSMQQLAAYYQANGGTLA